MTPELQKYYEDRFAMMATPGWKALMEDVQNMQDATNTLDGATLDNLQFRQGEVSLMRWLLTLKDVSEKTYEELKNESDV